MDISNKELLKDKCYINGDWITSNSKELIGGVRIQIADGIHPLPVEEAIGYLDKTIHEKVNLEKEYMFKKSFFLDLKILFMTALKVIKRHGISH